MSTGVVFRLRQPAIWAIQAIQRQMAGQAPKVPVIFIESKGREEENESDPDYQNALALHRADLTERLYDAVLVTGSEVVSVPDGIPAHDSSEFRDLLDTMGFALDANMQRRYVQWVKYIAAPDLAECADKLFSPLLRLMGTREDDVADAIDVFRSGEERGSDSAGSNQTNGNNGNRVPQAPAGASATVRGTGGSDV